MANYPVPNFHFKVEWGGSSADFTEASGFTVDVEPIEYRGGLSPEFTPTKRPGMVKYSNLSLKRGIFQGGDNEFFDWISTVPTEATDRRDLIVSLLNNNHDPVMVWKIKEAWPCKVEGPSMNSTGNEIAMESVELCHEGMTVEALSQA